MSEEKDVTTGVVKEEVVAVSEKEMEAISQEVGKVEDDKLEAAKAEGIKVGKSIAELEAELEKSRSERVAKEKELEEQAKRSELEKQIAEEKLASEKIQRKHVVPQSDNPTEIKVQEEEPLVKKTPAQEWAEFEAVNAKGQFMASRHPGQND